MAMMKQSEITLAMTIVQAWWRMCCTRKKFLQQRAAVVIIQSCLRSYTQRKRFRNYKESALKLQAFVRSRYARHRYCEYRDSVQKIQRCWRGVLAARSAKQKHEEMLIAVTRIQASWRKYLQRKSFLQKKAAATRLQSIFRSHQQRKAYTKLKNCAVKLQSLVRRRSKRRNYCRYVESVKKIQRCWKLALATRSAQRKRAESNNAATRIQAWWRQCAARRSFLELRADAVHLQRCIRSYIRRKEYKRYRERVVKVQALFRGRQERRKYIEYKDAALKIQAHVRVKKSLRACQNSAARKIQAAWRTMRLNKAATIIQARYRGWWQKQRYKVQVKQIIELKAVVKGKHLPCQFLQQVPAGTTTEQYCCGDIVDSTNKACNVASISFLLEEHGLKKNGNSPLSRPLTDKEHALSDGKSAAKSDGNSYEVIRRSIRTALQRRWFLQLRKCTLTLQRRWRCLLQRRRDAVTTIQRHFRGWQQRKGFYQKRMAIKNIQACWRGHLARQSHGHMKHQLLDLRQRMQNTAANVDNRMRLENRLTEALAALLSQKTVSGILHTCATIDLATQHSKLCCERLLEAGAIPKLLQLIQTTNRSPPHQEVLKHALSILASIGRYSEFATLVADAPRFIATVADQLLRNDDEVLTKVIKLLKLACKVPSGLQMVQKNPAVLRRLYSVSQALEKKVEVEARTLARLPTSASLIVRRSGEKKVSDAVAQHYSVVSLLQAVTGEDLQTRLKAVRRMSSIYQVPPPPRLSICRFPLQDCSNK